MKSQLLTIVLLSYLLSGFSQESNKIKFKGFVDSYHAVQIEKPNNLLASRSRFRGEVEKNVGSSYFYTSVNAILNTARSENSRIEFREVFMEYTAKNWGFKIGRQIIIWGKADGLKITDVISPMDLTEFLAQDFDDIRMPVNAIVFSQFGKSYSLDLVCVPTFDSYLLPDSDSPWGVDYEALGVEVDEAKEPELNLENIEFGGKLSFYLSGIDFDFTALRTWNKAPVYTYYVNDSTAAFHMKPEHHRLSFIGLGFSKSINSFVVRSEGAFYFDKKFSPKTESYLAGLQESNSLNYLIGIDWYPGGEWSVTGQFSDEIILDHTKENMQNKHTYLSTLGISKKVFRSTLALSTFIYLDLQEGSFYNSSKADYSLTDNIHAMIGYDWFEGSEGSFGQYEKNSQIWLKAKFSF